MGLSRRISALSLTILFAVSVPGIAAESGPPGTSFFTINSCRAFDTRIDKPPLASGTTRIFPVAGPCGIPSVARAISVNLAAIVPTGNGFLTAFAGDASLPPTSTINFTSGRTLANNAILSLSANGDGTIAIFAFVQNQGHVHAVLDINGYFAAEELEILSLSPSSAPQDGPERVLTVTGTGFQNGATVRFDGHGLATTQAALDRLTAVVPAARLEAPGTFPVQVINPDGTASEAALFTSMRPWP